jgi:hypothetical protein
MQHWIGCEGNKDVVEVIYPSLRERDEGRSINEILAREPIAALFRQADGKYTVVQKGVVTVDYTTRPDLNRTHVFSYGSVDAAVASIRNHEEFYRSVEAYLVAN